ncbi:5'/3'-nucleotidase SurE [Marinospirillum alkaliphilum]|uniref:5'-nucleotidase SurE n=1 Tax=Marinospirillum alkaliphilum DSM 21637 TaxID=1122209 RepID=A0A1K1V9J1_9GAMM|nr:5'/3'-nucleotidase SurE [Marinospirillum alkaliphilum]SFX21802.1 5'-nucleotidase /3'-nucleotidase /exopolyphosphatase [Marinospirillum alkaliphilum DSM 21637]
MKLLLSNDDGVHAAGLATLAAALEDLGELLVVAPDRNRSGASNSLSLDRPLYPQQLNNGFWSVDGTPTDCVHLAVGGVFGSLPDLVISGINHGANLGDDVLYSGTVAAATEGRFLGLPAIAVSLTGETHFATAAEVVRKLVRSFTEQASGLQLPPRSLLNVNVPDVPLFALKGYQVTRLGHRHRGPAPLQITDPRGKSRYWIAAAGDAAESSPGTDFHAISEGYVSITPLQFDMTRHESLDQVSRWLNSCN